MKSGVFILLCLTAAQLSAQPTALYSPSDREIFHEYLTAIEPYREASLQTVLEKTALFFVGKPYRAHTLEESSEEQLTVNLRAFDCTTFVETVLALTGMVKSDDPSFDIFVKELQSLRYRNGTIEGYASRLHYATDWLHENEQRGVLRNLSASLGGVHQEKALHFMSSHREAYSRLKEDDAMLDRIASMEEMVNRRGGYHYLPKGVLEAAADQIPHMSVVLFTTAIDGLDATHMGFAFRKGETLTFLHASSSAKKVKIDEKTISDYTLGQTSCTGIIVAEINASYSK